MARRIAASRSGSRLSSSAVAPVLPQHGQCGNQRIGAPVRYAGDHQMFRRRSAGDLLAMRHMLADQRRGHRAHADFIAAIADGDPPPRPARNRLSSGMVKAPISSPRMLRGAPSALRPQRSIDMRMRHPKPQPHARSSLRPSRRKARRPAARRCLAEPLHRSPGTVRPLQPDMAHQHVAAPPRASRRRQVHRSPLQAVCREEHKSR